ncbi:MAG: serine/threonine protein kinase, partial [Polyangiaceae bacterium]|nr:serine/threonine protein kinase [Polyangiaceae bacterium]
MKPKPALRPRTRFRGYTVQRLVAQGGMADVYEVTAPGGKEVTAPGGKRYALKILQRRWAQDEQVVGRTVDEGYVLVAMRHPNIVTVHEHGIDDGLPWMLMEFIDGFTLREEMTRRAPVSFALACAWLRSAAYALHQLHQFAIIHRDVKPENFMMKPRPGGAPLEAILLDLGVARIVRPTDTLQQGPMGTPAYMAPEQFNARLPVGPPTDVFSLGVMSYEILGRKHPIDASSKDLSAWEYCFEQSFTVPPPLAELGVPPEIAAVVDRAMAKDPRARWPSALEYGDELWSAWKAARARDPSLDTEPGEPPVEAIASVPHVLGPGTGPIERRNGGGSGRGHGSGDGHGIGHGHG